LFRHPRAAAVGGNTGENYLPRRLPTVRSLIRETSPSAAAGANNRQPNLRSGTTPLAAALMVPPFRICAGRRIRFRFYPAWYEDVDFCKQLKAAGWQIYFDPTARFLHEGGYSAKALGAAGFNVAYYRNQLRYVRKHMGTVASLVVRCSIALGMVARMISAPSDAGAFFTVLAGALGRW
jgi:hypothetical protein